MFTLSSLLITALVAVDGDYETCPQLQTNRKIDAIMLVHSGLVDEIESWEETIAEVQDRLIARENQVLRRNLNLEIRVREWIRIEHDKESREVLCSSEEDAVTLYKNLRVLLDNDNQKVEKYPFWGFAHKCDFAGRNPATVVNWVMRIGGNNPDENRDAKFSYGAEAGFGYQYLVRHGASILGAWHSEKGHDVMLPEARPSKVFSQEATNWICEYGFTKDEGATTTEAPPAERG